MDKLTDKQTDENVCICHIRTFNFFDDVDGSDEDPDAMVALGLVVGALAEQEGVVSGKVGVVLHTDTATLHPVAKVIKNYVKVSNSQRYCFITLATGGQKLAADLS
jgi:hypothetical protein